LYKTNMLKKTDATKKKIRC